MATIDPRNAGGGPLDVSELSQAQRLLAERLLAARRSSAAPSIPRRRPGNDIMSDAQRQLVILAQLAGDSRPYHQAQVFRLRGPLDGGALHRAFDLLVERHSALRTRFVDLGRTNRIEFSDGPADFRIVPITDVDEFVQAVVSQPFDLAAGQLLRVRVGQVAPDDHVLAIVLHHAAGDAASKQLLWRELTELYAAQLRGDTNPLPPVALEYADFAAWVEDSGRAERDVEWWRDTLAGAPEQTDLPLDRPRSAHHSTAGVKYTHRLSARLTRDIEDFARTERATTFNVLLAAYAGLLERYGGQGEVVVGSPTSGRHHAPLQDVVGLFLNTLPLRIDTAGNPSFAELVARVKDVTVAAYRHQDASFARIVEAVRPTRAMGFNPIYQTILTLKDSESTPPALAGVDVQAVPFEGGWTKFDLSIIGYPTGDQLALLWQYSTDLFDPDTVVRMAGCYERLLAEGIADPSQRLDQVKLAAADDERLVSEWQGAERPESQAVLPDLFEAQVRRVPGQRAVGDDAGWLTFEQLDQRANRLARHLIHLGVGPDRPVGICLERSCELLVAVLAVLKAGGCYVPIDPSLPAERAGFMVSDSEAVALITSTTVTGHAPEHPNSVVIDDLDLSGYDATAPSRSIGADNLAYVIYTSGTTGRPKGVAMEHRGVVNQLEWMQRRLQLTGDDTVLQRTPFSFDVAGWELLWAPIAGARLFMARPGAANIDPRYLVDVIREQQISVINFVPSMLTVFLGSHGVEECVSLRMIIAAGEALSDECKKTCLSVLPGAELHNIYGPTETIGITHEQCRDDQTVTIGRPIDNCEAFVLDGALRPQPIGMPGELYLAGRQLARGYIGRPDLTAERFVPLSSATGGIAYRTGDRAVWKSDGRLQFLGRLDDQVKLRGFRIELGEVEGVLGSATGVANACVAVVDGTSGHQLLAGFVVPDPEALQTVAAPAESELLAEAQMRWERTYGEGRAVRPQFDIRGWVNRATGRPFAEAEMQEWLAATSHRLQALRPRSVLEVGAGSGLVLWRLAPETDRYVAVDFSASAVRQLQDQLQRAGSRYVNVDAQCLAAHELSQAGLQGSFDTAVVNSVVQDFPSERYLREVLQQLVGLVSPAGRIFVGDVRDLRLLEAFSIATEAERGPLTSASLLRARVRERCRLDDELLVDPALFLAFPGVSHVQVLPKRGHADTEMNKFRYDVVLHVGAAATQTIPTWHDWQSLTAGSTTAVEALDSLLETGAEQIGVRGISNLRVTSATHAVHPETLHELAATHGYELELSVAADPARVDAAFTRSGAPTEFAPLSARSHEPQPLTSLPAAARALARQRAECVDAAADRARAQLPSYSVPTIIRALDEIPLTPNGKLDRAVLQGMAAEAKLAPPVPPRTETERRVGRLWQEALGLDQPPSVSDDFFDLGGHSVLALTLFPKLEREFNVRLSLPLLFENPVLADLAEAVDRARSGQRTRDCLVRLWEHGGKSPLFAMPGHGGDVLPFQRMQPWLDPQRPLYGIECLGLDGHTQPRWTIEEIAADCVEQMRRVQPEGPYLVIGYCFGGVVAYEAATQLLRSGQEVAFVGLVDATPFGRGAGGRRAPAPRSSRLKRIAVGSWSQLSRKAGVARHLGRRRVSMAVARLCRRRGWPIPARFVDIPGIHDVSMQEYVAPDSPLRVALYTAASDVVVSEELRRQRWAQVAHGGVDNYAVRSSGVTHHNIARAQHAIQLATTINRSLRAID
jgi:amino acid adenylation domain-containing protein